MSEMEEEMKVRSCAPAVRLHPGLRGGSRAAREGCGRGGDEVSLCAAPALALGSPGAPGAPHSLSGDRHGLRCKGMSSSRLEADPSGTRKVSSAAASPRGRDG